MFGMNVPVQLFCHWSAEFSVEFVPPAREGAGGTLRFFPQRKSGRVVRREWFTYWFSQSLKGKAALQPVNLLLQLTSFGEHEWPTEPFQKTLLAVAQELGPLLSPLPGHRAVEATYLEEDVAQWCKAAQDIRDIGVMLERLPTLSRDGSKTARKRRALRAGEAEYPGEWDAVTPQARREFSAPYKASPGISPLHQASGHLGALMDRVWFPDVNLPGVPSRLGLPHLRLAEEGFTLQINVPTGMQALLVLALQDQRLGRNLLIRECARPTCRVSAFMSPKQRYCSDRCRNAAGVQRHADKAKQQRTGTGKVGRPRKTTNQTQ